MSDALPAQFPPIELLPALLDASLTGVVLFLPVYGPAGELVDFTFAYLNPAAQRILGLSPQPTVSYRQQFPHSTDPANGAFVFQRDAYLSGQPAQFELNYQEDGYDNYFRATARRVGEGLLVCVTDTADQPRTAVEVALRQSQAREQAAHAQAEAQRQRLLNDFAQAPVLMARLAGPDHVVELANEGFRQLFGGRQMAGQPYRQAASELAGQGFFKLLDAVYRTGETYAATEAPTYLPQAEPGPPAPRYFNFIYQATRDAAGRIDGVLVVASEVTEAVRARELLEEQARELTRLNQELEARVEERTQALRHAQVEAEATAQKLQHVTESLPSTSFTVDQSGQVFYISPQWYAYTGMVPGTNINEAWPQLMHPDDLPAVAQEYGAALAGGRPWGYEFRLRGADGQYRWFASQGVPEPLAAAEAAGRTRQWFGSNLDIDDLKRAQQQLEEKDQLLSSILSSIPASVVTFEGEEMRLGFFNEPYQRRAEGRAVLGRPAGEVFPEAEEQGFLTLLREVMRTGEPYLVREMFAYTRDPSTGEQGETYLDQAYLPLRYGQQPPHAVLNFFVDATDRVLARRQAEAAHAQALAAAEQTAAQREAFYRVFEQTPALVCLLRGADHRYEYFNPAYQQLFPGRQLLGRTVVEAVPEAVEHGFLALLDGVYQTGEPYFGLELLLPVTRTDGQPPQDAYFDFTYQAQREAGQIVGISMFAFDVTERVRARRQREAQQVQLAELFEQAPVAITVLRGPEYVIEVANPLVAQLWGRTPEQVRGKTLYEALPEVRDQGFKELLDQVVTSGEAFVAQEVPAQLPRAGQLVTVYLNFVYQPLRDAQGRIDSVAAVATDVTDQVLARQQLAHANEQLTAANGQLTRVNVDLDNFIYTASHDLKHPIANIEGLLNALNEELPAALRATSGLIDPILDRMMESVERFKRTIDSLTDITRLQREHQPASAPVSLAAVLDDVCFDLDGLLAAPGVRLTHDVAGCPPLLFPEKNLRSVLYNLLSNALKYRSPHRPLHVVINCQAVPGYQVLEVHDNGLGIAPAQQPRLFSMFQRFHDHVAGTGIGLYMVKRMVENAGGRIEVHSQEGAGTTFFVYFPVTTGLPA